MQMLGLEAQRAGLLAGKQKIDKDEGARKLPVNAYLDVWRAASAAVGDQGLHLLTSGCAKILTTRS